MKWSLRLAAVCCVAAVLFDFDRAAAKPVNVVVILADDMGFSDLGCYGGEIATPELDALAQGGLRFSQFYNTARCWPTRAALLTGYYAQQVRRDGFPGGSGKGPRPAWADLLPRLLRPLGYRSYHSGKWHIDGAPIEGGFDRSYFLSDDNRFFNPHTHFRDDERLPPVEPGSGYYSTVAIADHAIECLRDHAERHVDKPFFQYVAFLAPHFPLHALPEDIEKYRDTYQSGWEAIRAARWKRQQELGIINGRLSPVERDLGPPYHFPKALKQLGPGEVNRPLPWEELTAEQQEFQAQKMAVHAAMVDCIDQQVGRLIAQLREMDALDNTLVLFLSDNGASAEIMVRGDGHDPEAPPGSAATFLCLGPGWSTSSNTPFRRHKTWVHEGGIATPLIAHWPAGIEAQGEWRHRPGHVIDIAPTILELAGGSSDDSAGPKAYGESLVPEFRSGQSAPRDWLWWLHEGHRAFRSGDWKLVAAKGEPWELYDLATDRSETSDLAATHPDKVRELEEQWQQRADEFRQHAAEKD